jgi:hypothetical protein
LVRHWISSTDPLIFKSFFPLFSISASLRRESIKWEIS